MQTHTSCCWDNDMGSAFAMGNPRKLVPELLGKSYLPRCTGRPPSFLCPMEPPRRRASRVQAGDARSVPWTEEGGSAKRRVSFAQMASKAAFRPRDAGARSERQDGGEAGAPATASRKPARSSKAGGLAHKAPRGHSRHEATAPPDRPGQSPVSHSSAPCLKPQGRSGPLNPWAVRSWALQGLCCARNGGAKKSHPTHTGRFL